MNTKSNCIINKGEWQHASGTTVVMITHDPNNAKQAQRIIKIVEGKIVA
jgi:ABC-type lipoprotein export system ATPase subunit